ncbi:hypothetical protein [Shewanella piezotolerans]|nr:hypothetical protein [Shewanella piezotolerans]
MLKRVLLLLTILLSCFIVTVMAKSSIEKPVSFIAVSGYKKHHLLVAKFDGIVNKMNIHAGQVIDGTQLMFSIFPLDPTLTVQQEFTLSHNTLVAKTYVRQGDKVARYQKIAKLANKLDLFMVGHIHRQDTAPLFIGKPVTVSLDPDGTPFAIKGKVIAFEHSESGPNIGVRVEIDFDITNCLKDSRCVNFLKPGVLAKVSIDAGAKTTL